MSGPTRSASVRNQMIGSSRSQPKYLYVTKYVTN